MSSAPHKISLCISAEVTHVLFDGRVGMSPLPRTMSVPTSPASLTSGQRATA